MTIRRFDAVAEWLPFVKSSPIEDGGDPTRVGCVRVLTQTDGEVFREVLVALSDAERFYSYTFVSSPVPVHDHVTTLRVLPLQTVIVRTSNGHRGSISPQNSRRSSLI